MTDFGKRIVELKNSNLLIKRKDFKILWHLDYYDSPITGIGLYNNKFFYFSLDDCFKRRKSVYKIVELSIEEFKEELYSHEMFRIYVGFHTDYHLPIPQVRAFGFIHPRENWENYYGHNYSIDRQKYSTKEVIGYFVI